jgi:hypothetical protein
MGQRTIRSLALAALVLLAAPTAFPQENKSATGNGTTAAITATTSPMDLARAAFQAQGGEKLRAVKNMVLRGSVDLYAPNSTQSIPGGFVIVTAGDKLRLEVDARPAITFKQIFNGQQTYSSMPGVDLPPVNAISVLSNFDQAGYTVSAIPDKKKQRGFRIADPKGTAIDYYIDTATGRVMSFLIPYGNYTFGTENKKFKDIEGVLVPSSFTQRLEMPQGAFFADFNVKDIKLNQTFGDDVFAIP